MACTDEAVIDAMKKSKDMAMHYKVPTFKAVFIGSLCHSLYITPVSAQIGCQRDVRPFDLSVREYVTLLFPVSTIAVNMDEFMISVSQYPVESPVVSTHTYTIFLSNDPYDFVNEMLRALPGGLSLKTRGSILVVKSRRETGLVENIDISEVYFIKRLLVDTLLERAARSGVDALSDSAEDGSNASTDVDD